MKKYFTFLFVVLGYTILAQTTASLKSDNAEKPIYLKDWDIDIKVIGNIAVTTQKMVFYNPNDRILSGEFNFPLNDGQSVSRFALEINGVLREGSIVDKEKGRSAYEKVIRQKVDPGLLEMTKGNNFRSRVYPIPALGTKTILIAYEQILTATDSGALYILPMNNKDSIPSVHIKTSVFKNTYQPKWLENDIVNFDFKKWEENYIAEKSLANFHPSSKLSFIIPFNNTPVSFMEQSENETYFYTYQNFKGNMSEKKLPKSVVILWDVSGSVNRDAIVKEINFLNLYLQRLKDASIDLITFSSAIHSNERFYISDSNTDSITDRIIHLSYDGGTQLGAIDLAEYNYADEILVFTDGISNFGNQKIVSASQKPVYTINASPVANHDYLRVVAMENKGAYINLLAYNIEDAIKKISFVAPRVINIKVTDGTFRELYPVTPFSIYDNINISGILKSNKCSLLLTIDNAGVKEERVISLSNNEINNESVQKVWANKKLSFLMNNPEKNQQAIKETGLKYGIVTPYTSLIVLDNLDDYVRYEIVPPADMQKEYWEKMAEKVKQKAENKKEENDYIREQLSVAYEDMEDRMEWWEEDFEYNPTKPAKNTTGATNNINPTNSGNNLNTGTTININTTTNTLSSSGTPSQTTPPSSILVSYDSSQLRTINGSVKDAATGEALIGVNVTGKGTTIGTVTDIDGKYTLTLPKDITTLFFSYIGYSDLEKPILSLTENVAMKTNGATMEEVVVTAMSISRSARTESYSIRHIIIDDPNTASATIFNSVQSRVAGVRINSENTVTNSIILNESFTNPNDALIVMDGIPINNNSNTNEFIDFGIRDNDIDPSEINSITVLKKEKATALYGSRAANGVIFIHTKYNTEEEEEEAEDSAAIKDTSNTTGKGVPVYILDDSVVPLSYIKLLGLDSITSIQIIPAKDAISRYGDMAKYGALIFSTKTDSVKSERILNTEKKLSRFIEELKALPSKQQYDAYLLKRKYNPENFSFYMDVANYFYTSGRKQEGLRILSNIAELELENHELMRAMAYMLESWKETDYALDAYSEILKIKGEEPQSHRDYALALAQKGNYQKAVDILYGILTKKWEDSEDRFEGIEGIIINEMNQIIKASHNKVNTSGIEKRFLKAMPVAVRVVCDWNKDETDIDLHVEEPSKEECSYKLANTQIGGRISNDFTEGYGPEEYLIKKGWKGTYKIKVDYYGDEVQKIQTPAVVKTTIFKNYNSGKTTMETIIRRLSAENKEEENNIEIGRMVLGK